MINELQENKIKERLRGFFSEIIHQPMILNGIAIIKYIERKFNKEGKSSNAEENLWFIKSCL